MVFNEILTQKMIYLFTDAEFQKLLKISRKKIIELFEAFALIFSVRLSVSPLI